MDLLSPETSRMMAHAQAIADWEYRASMALARQRHAPSARIEACLRKWIAKGRLDCGPALPLGMLYGRAADQLAPGVEDGGARYLRRMARVADAVTEHFMRVHATSLDVVEATEIDPVDYPNRVAMRVFEAVEIEGDARDVPDLLHDAVLNVLRDHGATVAKRRPLLDQATALRQSCTAIRADAMEFAEEFSRGSASAGRRIDADGIVVAGDWAD